MQLLDRPLRVLVTGACGFIGHHVVDAMAKSGHEVVALDRLDETSTQQRIANLSHDIPVVWHDLRSRVNGLVSSLIGRVDAIFHLAASTHVDRSIQDSMPFVQDNVVGTAHLLEYARNLEGLKLFLNFSTDECFGPAPKGVSYKEEDRYDPRNPYSSTKTAAVELAHSYANTYGIPVITTHCMNVFGPGQHPEKYIPLVIGSVLRGRVVPIHIDVVDMRPGTRFYIHAGNVANLMVQVLDAVMEGRWVPPDKMNIPGELEIDNLEMAQKIADCVGEELRYELVDFHSTRPGHDLRYALDGEKLKGLGFEIPRNFGIALQKTVDWYLENREWLLL